jgi:hypothetical protein
MPIAKPLPEAWDSRRTNAWQGLVSLGLTLMRHRYTKYRGSDLISLEDQRLSGEEKTMSNHHEIETSNLSNGLLIMRCILYF